MGWKGNIRSVRTALRQADRAATRRQRELEQQRRELSKLEAHEQAKLEVEEHENYVERLITLHKEVGQRMDWAALAKEEEPAAPIRSQVAEEAARTALASYRPSLLDRLLGRSEKRRATLEEALEQAPVEDQEAHERLVQRWEAKHAEWRESTDLAAQVLEGDTTALATVVRELRPCAEIAELGSRLEFHAEKGLPLHVVLHIHGEEVLPKQAKSLLRTGRISEKPLPKGRYNELYQDHVCSALLRVARCSLCCQSKASLSPRWTRCSIRGRDTWPNRRSLRRPFPAPSSRP